MISVDAALDHLFQLVSPLGAETVPLRDAAGRLLAGPVRAKRTQPPFDVSAMDGYALRAAEVERDAQFKVIGVSAAGHGYSGRVGPGQAVRILTGAPLPDGTDCVAIQEDVTRRGDLIAITGERPEVGHVRPAGGDFSEGDPFEPSGPLAPGDIALLASMNHAELSVQRKPVVALIATGDELVQPGEVPGPDQIIASNSYGLAALLEAEGAVARILPAARDTADSLRMSLQLARGADLIVTIGGASVGDHDIVREVADDLGMERAFYKVAMRPGKPLMAGRLSGTPMVGLPGNPVSAMVCGTVFLVPMIRVMLGLPAAPAPRVPAMLAHGIEANGPREHYMRARIDGDSAEIFDRQDSSLLGVLSRANALAVRPPHDPARAAGERLEFIRIRARIS